VDQLAREESVNGAAGLICFGVGLVIEAYERDVQATLARLADVAGVATSLFRSLRSYWARRSHVRARLSLTGRAIALGRQSRLRN
jgi:hypothetical protein